MRLTRTGDSLLFDGLRGAFEHVARSAHGFQKGRMIGVAFDFLPEPADVNVDAARRHEALGAPNGVQQLVARKHPVRTCRQIIEQAELQRRERYRRAVTRYAVGGRLDGQPARLNHAGHLAGGLRTPQKGFYTSTQLSWAEWLGDIIVRPHFKSHHAVRFLASRGEDQNRPAAE